MREEQKPAAVAVPPGWRLVPAEPTAEWEAALGEKGMRISTMSKSIADVLAAAPQPPVAAHEPFGYVNTHTGQFFKDVEPCRQNNEGHWRTVYTLPAPQPAPVAQPAILGPEHKGMRVDYSGLFKQARGALACGIKEPALAEMLRQFQDHMQELGQRWYAGDTAVIDELLQLYCIEQGARAQAKEGGA